MKKLLNLSTFLTEWLKVANLTEENAFLQIYSHFLAQELETELQEYEYAAKQHYLKVLELEKDMVSAKEGLTEAKESFSKLQEAKEITIESEIKPELPINCSSIIQIFRQQDKT